MVDTTRMRDIPDSIGRADPRGLTRRVSSMIHDLFGERVPAERLSVEQRDEIVYADLVEGDSPRKEFGYAIALSVSSHPHLIARMGSLENIYRQKGYAVVPSHDANQDLLAFSYSRERGHGAR